VRLQQHVTAPTNPHVAAWFTDLSADRCWPIARLIATANDQTWATAERYWIAFIRQRADLLNDKPGGGSTYKESEVGSRRQVNMTLDEDAKARLDDIAAGAGMKAATVARVLLSLYLSGYIRVTDDPYRDDDNNATNHRGAHG